jgi:hypothetical protein
MPDVHFPGQHTSRAALTVQGLPLSHSLNRARAGRGGEIVANPTNLPGPVQQVAFDPQGRHLATANSNGTIYRFRLFEPDAATKQ